MIRSSNENLVQYTKSPFTKWLLQLIRKNVFSVRNKCVLPNTLGDPRRRWQKPIQPPHHPGRHGLKPKVSILRTPLTLRAPAKTGRRRFCSPAENLVCCRYVFSLFPHQTSSSQKRLRKLEVFARMAPRCEGKINEKKIKKTPSWCGWDVFNFFSLVISSCLFSHHSL